MSKNALKTYKLIVYFLYWKSVQVKIILFTFFIVDIFYSVLASNLSVQKVAKIKIKVAIGANVILTHH